MEKLSEKKVEAYDPLDYGNLARNVVRALMEQQRVSLPPAESFGGVGVYAIYYKGNFKPYSFLRGGEVPIYVGSAVTVGKRKGLRDVTSGRQLYTRLVQHSKSIDVSENLDLGDFCCRYLIVVPVWIELAERFLIEHYRPIWNTVIEGFGNHDPGAGRKDMKRPRWDILHPGRPWAQKLKAAESPSQILEHLSR
jgi:hypothetical protein